MNADDHHLHQHRAQGGSNLGFMLHSQHLIIEASAAVHRVVSTVIDFH
jgi:hypothetical protein